MVCFEGIYRPKTDIKLGIGLAREVRRRIKRPQPALKWSYQNVREPTPAFKAAEATEGRYCRRQNQQNQSPAWSSGNVRTLR